MTPQSSRPPAGVPGHGGNTKYAIVAVLLVLGVVALFAWRSMANKPSAAVLAPAPSLSQAIEPSNPKIEDIPPPPQEEAKPEAGPGGPRIIYVQAGGCEGKCSGTPPPELAQALQVRASQARRCYNEALGRDPSLRGHVTVAVRIGTAGNVCAVNVTSNDMGTPAVANCAANIIARSGTFPVPRGGCIDATVPMAFVPQGQ